ncbi:MAG TPA: hypothetical protein EYP56_20910 [Planctomycetaceae bacterium]|nr:hypothetical protein [Planctomycetaceae bacterium]
MSETPLSATDVAEQLAAALDAEGYDYAFGGAISLGYWGQPRGTVDVDLTLFLAPDKPSECVRCLQQIGCDLDAAASVGSLQELGFCRVFYRGVPVDVFLPIAPFYEVARERRKKVYIGRTVVVIWDAESLAVFKMVFFRRKDLADVEQILRCQRPTLDRGWIRTQLIDMFGQRDPRVAEWGRLVAELDDEDSS